MVAYPKGLDLLKDIYANQSSRRLAKKGGVGKSSLARLIAREFTGNG